MSAFLRYVLLTLAQVHMIVALLMVMFVLSPYAEWACVKGKNPWVCKERMSLWKLGDAYPDSVVYSVQVILMCTALINFASVIVGGARMYKEAVAVLDALCFVFSIIPWALIIGMLDKANDRLASGVWIAVGSSFVYMVAASLGLTAILMPDDRAQIRSEIRDEESKQILLPAPISKLGGDMSLLAVLDLFAYVAVAGSVGSLLGLYQADESFFSLSAEGCQIAVTLLAIDAAVLTTCVHRRLIDVQMGSIVAASMSLVGWITGIPGCTFTTIALGSFEFASACALIAILSSVGVFGTGIYISTHFG